MLTGIGRGRYEKYADIGGCETPKISAYETTAIHRLREGARTVILCKVRTFCEKTRK